MPDHAEFDQRGLPSFAAVPCSGVGPAPDPADGRRDAPVGDGTLPIATRRGLARGSPSHPDKVGRAW
eukprot:8168030-Prorocentrum_lima.AAC.1